MKYLTIQDLKEVGQISSNCDRKKIKIAENEAFDFDLTPLIDCYSNEIKENWNEEEGIWRDIINPLNFDVNNCSKCGYHKGLKKVLAYFTFARYMILNQFNDTPNGNVSKRIDFSLPTSMELLKDRSGAYRQMANYTFKSIKEYMNLNRNVYPRFFPTESEAKGFGARIKNIY